MTAGDVMDQSAVLLNDAAKDIYTYTTMLPYLKIAYDELAEQYETNNIPITNETNTSSVITTAMTDIGGSTGPALPTDLIEPRTLYERLDGTTDDYIPMTKKEFLPPFTELTDSLVYWVWQDQIIKFLGALTDRDVRIDYIGNTLTPLVDNTTIISAINSKSFLSFRTAALCAAYIGENPDRASQLQGDADNALGRLLNIPVKSNQAIATRRRPFRSRAKMLGY